MSFDRNALDRLQQIGESLTTDHDQQSLTSIQESRRNAEKARAVFLEKVRPAVYRLSHMQWENDGLDPSFNWEGFGHFRKTQLDEVMASYDAGVDPDSIIALVASLDEQARKRARDLWEARMQRQRRRWH